MRTKIVLPSVAFRSTSVLSSDAKLARVNQLWLQEDNDTTQGFGIGSHEDDLFQETLAHVGSILFFLLGSVVLASVLSLLFLEIRNRLFFQKVLNRGINFLLIFFQMKPISNDTPFDFSDVCKLSIPRHIAVIMDGNRRYGRSTYGFATKGHADGGKTFVKNPGTDKEEVLDNSRVVPHNIFLLMKYRCHLNVEVCNSITAVKYLYKYVYKGHDKVMYGVKSKDHLDLPADQTRGPARDEVQEFVEARYCSTSEACWCTFEFSMGSLYPRVQRLNVHLEDEQHVLFSSDSEETRQQLKDSEHTQLTAFFMLCNGERVKLAKCVP